METNVPMTSAQATASRGVPSIVPILNPLIRRLLGAGLPMGPNVLITVRGRKSGQLRTFPVAILEIGGRRYVQSPFGEVNWVRNLRATPEAVVTRGHDRDEVEAVEIPPEQAAPLFREGLAPFQRSRVLRVLVRNLLHVGTNMTLAEYAEHARTHPMFELRPRSAAQATGRAGGAGN